MSLKYDLVKLLPKAHQYNVTYHPGIAFDPEGEIGKIVLDFVLDTIQRKKLKKGSNYFQRS